MKVYILIKKEESDWNGDVKKSLFSRPSFDKNKIESLCSLEEKRFNAHHSDLEVEFEVGVFKLEKLYNV